MALEILRERDLAERPVRRDGNGATGIADGPRRHTPSGTARLPEVHRGVHLRRGTMAPPAHRGVHVTGAADSDDSDRPQERRPPAVRGRGAPARGRKLRLALRPARAPRSGNVRRRRRSDSVIHSPDPWRRLPVERTRSLGASSPTARPSPPRGSVKDRTLAEPRGTTDRLPHARTRDSPVLPPTTDRSRPAHVEPTRRRTAGCGRRSGPGHGSVSVGAPQRDRRRACSRASSCRPPRSAGGGSRRPAHARAVDRASKIR